jgi:adenosylcobinamide-phosphate synthase
MRRAHWLKADRGGALALALGIDLAFGEPPTALHPVVWLGRLIAALERRAPESKHARFLYGAAGAGLVVGGSAGCGALLATMLRHVHPLPRTVAMAWVLKATFSFRGLAVAAERVRDALAEEDLEAARRALRSLVSRDVATLTPSLAAAAAVESVAENACDSIVAPLAFYAVAGLPGAMAYRAANTLDSMWGYHGTYEYLGKAAARMDDLANLLPARLTGLLLVGASRLCGHDARAGWRTMWRDHRRTASPNAGWPMSAMAGALGIELEKVGQYRLGSPGKPATPESIGEALGILNVATALMVGGCVVKEVACAA